MGVAADVDGPHRPLAKTNAPVQADSGRLDFCDVIVPTVPLNPTRSHLNGAPKIPKLHEIAWRT
jgi:hypothetical protein